MFIYMCYPDLSTAHSSNYGAIFLRKCLQPIWLQSTFNNTKRSPSQCRASGMEFLCLVRAYKSRAHNFQLEGTE